MGVYPHRWSTVLENAEKEPEKKSSFDRIQTNAF